MLNQDVINIFKNSIKTGFDFWSVLTYIYCSFILFTLYDLYLRGKISIIYVLRVKYVDRYR